VIAGELRRLRLRAFGESPSGQLQTRFPALHALAAAGGCDLESLVFAACERLGSENAGRARLLFGLDAATRGRSHKYRTDLTRRSYAPEPSASTFRQQPQYLPVLLDDLAVAVLAAAGTSTADPTSTRRIRPDRGVARLALEARVLASASAGPVNLWGEPGSGKSHLARACAQATARDWWLIRCVRSRGGESRDMYAHDLARCLAAYGTPTDGWGVEALERGLLALARDRPMAVILDDADQPIADVIAQSGRTAASFMLTSRHRLAGMAAVRVGEFSDAEAAKALALAALRDVEAPPEVMKRLGNRPLLLHLAGRGLRLGIFDLDGLGSLLAHGALASADALLRGQNPASESMSALYAALLDGLTPAARQVLQYCYWLSSDRMSLSLLSEIAQGMPPALVDLVLMELADVGLVEREGADVKINTLSVWLLRELTAPTAVRVARDFAEQIEDAAARGVLDPNSRLSLLGAEYAAVRSALRSALGCDAGALCLDDSLWLCWQGDEPWLPAASGPWLVEVAVPHRYFGAAGAHVPASRSDAGTLFGVSGLVRAVLDEHYSALLAPAGEGLARADGQMAPPSIDAQGPLRLIPASGDGSTHRLASVDDAGRAMAAGKQVWAVCGRRWAPTKRHAERRCPDCDALMDDREHWAAIARQADALWALARLLPRGSEASARAAIDLLLLGARAHHLSGSDERAIELVNSAYASVDQGAHWATEALMLVATAILSVGGELGVGLADALLSRADLSPHDRFQVLCFAADRTPASWAQLEALAEELSDGAPDPEAALGYWMDMRKGRRLPAGAEERYARRALVLSDKARGEDSPLSIALKGLIDALQAEPPPE